MKKLLFLLSFLLVSCGKDLMYETSLINDFSKIENIQKKHEVFCAKPVVYNQEIKLKFLEFEASTFEVFVISDKTTNICIGFFRADDVDHSGKVKTGKSIIRMQTIPLPREEMVEHYCNSGVELTRFDGTKHYIKFIAGK